MKALTLTQPWATLVAIGAKRIETRSWATSYRGRIAIHAAKGFPRSCRELCEDVDFLEALYPEYGIEADCNRGLDINDCAFDMTEAAIDLKRLPRGVVLATAELITIISTNALCAADICAAYKIPMSPEHSFGDYSEDRFAWILDNVVKLPSPIPAKGALGLWEWQPR